MQQQIAVITLSVADLARSKRFYVDGFGWSPVFGNEEIVFYQMNGLMLGPRRGHAEGRPEAAGGVQPRHNVRAQKDVAPMMDRLAGSGGRILRQADAPPQGGFRGYVADPDDHSWEIAFNPAWRIDEQGLVTFGL